MIIFISQFMYRSFSMALVVFFYSLTARILIKRYSAKSFYYAGLLILLAFLIPFRPNILIPVPMGYRTAGLSMSRNFLYGVFALPEKGHVQQQINHVSAIHNRELSSGIIFLVWLLVIFLVLFCHAIQHIRFLKTVNRWSTNITHPTLLLLFDEIRKQLGITTRLRLCRCSCISSPMLLHLFHPVILLPDTAFSAEDLKLILTHEMIHFKRRDLIYKYLLILAVAANWFNPAVYLFAKLFTQFCELSCDEIVTENMDEHGRFQYVTVIMRAACQNQKAGTAFSTFFNGGKEKLKIRIASIMYASKKRFGVLLPAICSILILGSGTALVASENTGTSIDGTDDFPSYSYDIKTADEIKLEIEEAFSEQFDPAFHEADFPGMTVTYDEDGIPIVTGPDSAPSSGTVTATTRYAKNGFYSSSDCSSSSLVFYTLKDQTVEVIDSAYFTSAAKVVFAGSTGYMKKSKLKF